MPIQARRNYSDFLELTPGVISRGFDDGSGRQVYFGHATEHFAHVLQLDGTIATNYHDAQLTYVSMGADMVADTQVKTGGVDAASPMGTGLVMNIITKSGGNTFRGSGAFAYQPYDWNGDNVDNCSAAPGCVPGTRRHADHRLRAAVRRRAGRPADARQGLVLRRAAPRPVVERHQPHLGRGRPPRGVSTRSAGLFDNDSESWQPFVKVTSKFGTHDVQAFYQRDRLLLSGDREYNYEPIQVQSTGGPLYSGKITSVWGSSVTTSFSGVVQRQGRLGCLDLRDARADRPANHHPRRRPRRRAARCRAPAGSSRAATCSCTTYQPASQIIVRGDLTYYKDGWAGNHELQTGFFYAPRNTYNQDTHYVNDGFVLEEHRPDRRQQHRRRHGPVPPPLPDPGRPADAAGRGSRLCHLRPGLVAADNRA